LFVLRLRTGNDLRDQADLASARSVTTGSWFSDCIGASGLLVVVGSQGSSSAKSELSLLAERSGTSASSLLILGLRRVHSATRPVEFFPPTGVVSRSFVAARHPFRKRVSGCIQSTSFRHRNHFFVFRNEHAQSTTLVLKLMFGVVSHNFVAARNPFRKLVSGCI
jgi:hypothetical protein